LCSRSRNFEHFMEPENSILCLQEPSTGPYAEPYQSIPHHPILSNCNLYYVSIFLSSESPSNSLFSTTTCRKSNFVWSAVLLHTRILEVPVSDLCTEIDYPDYGFSQSRETSTSTARTASSYIPHSLLGLYSVNS
jgi:hypothetical protein